MTYTTDIQAITKAHALIKRYMSPTPLHHYPGLDGPPRLRDLRQARKSQPPSAHSRSGAA